MNEWEWQLLEDKTVIDHVEISGIKVRSGNRVRLNPRKGGDVLDLVLSGQVATIEAIEQDYEGKVHISVVLDDDPGKDMGLLRQPGHRFFFDPQDVEPLGDGENAEISPSTKARVLVAGIGNIFLGDDGFGVEVVKQLANHALPSGLRVADFGIRALDLVYAMQDGYDATILVDACPRAEAPGTLFVVEPDMTSVDASEDAIVDSHSMDLSKVLRMAKAMNAEVKRVLLVGCEPEELGGEEGHIGLSKPVSVAVNEAVHLILSLATKLLCEAESRPLDNPMQAN